MRLKTFFLLIPLMVVLLGESGCLNTAIRDITPGDVQKLEPGVTTKSEMVAYYGEPYYQTVENNLSGLCFVNLGMRPRVLYVLFDNQGLLVNKQFNSDQAHTQCKTKNNGGGGGGTGATSGRGASCNMDIQCGVGFKCVDGVCAGGIGAGRCVEGNFGRKVCTNNGKRCYNDSMCF